MNIGKLCRGAVVLCGMLLLLLLCACHTQPQAPIEDSEATDSTAAEPVTDEPNTPDSKLLFAEDGTPIYRIVYPSQGGDMCLELSNAIADLVESKLGARPRVQKESASLLVDDQPTVYLGITEALYQADPAFAVGYGDYSIFTHEGDIYIAAYSYNALNQGVAYLNRQIKNGLDGKTILLDPPTKQATADRAFDNIPVYNTQNTAWGYSVGGNCNKLVLANATRADFDAYTAQLSSLSWTLSQKNDSGQTLFAAYTNGEDALFVNFFNGELHIMHEKKDEAFLPSSEQLDFKKLCNTKGYLLGVWGEGAYQNGMSMFYLLADGTFLVYDGGHNALDSANLYAQMQNAASKNGLAGVRVSAWILTHAHGDHAGFFESFLQQYASRVKIDTLMINPTSAELGIGFRDGTALENSVQKAFRTYSPDTRVVRLHSGQQFWLADAHIQVLYTAEDLRQGYLLDYNDASIVTRITVGQKTVLITGDAANGAWGQLVRRYGAELKSDVLQVPHHGANPGGTVEAYDLIDPDVLLWTAGEKLYNSLLATMNPQICAHLVQMVHSENLHIAGVIGDVTEFTF